MGTIFKRKIRSGITFEARVRMNGIDTSRSFDTRQQAKKWVVDTEQSIYKNTNVNYIENKTTLKELINKYLVEIVALQKSKTQVTNRWKRIIKLNKDLVNLPATKITPQHMLEYRNKRAVDGRRTTNLDLQHFHALFERAIKLWQFPIAKNPIQYVEKFKLQKGRYRPIYRAEYIKILKYAIKKNYKFYLAILLLKHCGFRPNEVFKLTMNDVDEVAKVLVVRESKTNQTRVVPINLFCISVIKKTQSIYKTKYIVPYTTHGFISAFRRVCKRLSIDNLQAYDFRRGFAQRFIDNNKGDIPTLARLGGWSSWDMVQRYYGKESIRS